MINKVAFLSGLSALAVAGAVILPGTIAAYQGDPTVTGPNYSPERHEAMTEAFANKDYQAWKELFPGNGRAKDIVNADNFARFAEAHDLAVAGNTEAANQIRTELGLGQGQRSGAGNGQHTGYGRNR